MSITNGQPRLAASLFAPCQHVLMPEAPLDIEEENRRALFADLYRKTEDKVALLFSEDGSYNYPAISALRRSPPPSANIIPPTTDHEPIKEPPLKKAKRTIDEDDYDDDDDDEEDDEPSQSASKPHSAGAPANTLLSPSKSGSSPVHSVTSPSKHGDKSKDQDGSQSKDKDGEDAIKKLEEARTATEAAARRSFHTIFHTLENDHAAMLEQQQLEDSEKQLQAEMDHNHHPINNHSAVPNQGSLSSANLGASSLTLKHLIARIDMKRDQVRASDAELRLLMNEVRKNRSKWASEENVNQEELYEALEKVLTELKAHTEYSTPFLTRVNKRDAPDYYNFIKNPMDLGTMTKKLKSLTYKSKADFVVDLNLIWDNCLRYNQDMNHPLRRMANGMRKEAEKLIPLIPDLVIRSRAEVEAEERRKQNGGDDDAGEDSDDEPIMSSRGRKAGAKGTSKARKAPNDQKEDTPAIDQKPILQSERAQRLTAAMAFATPPIAGSLTPSGVNGHSGMGSNADAMDIDGPSINGLALNSAFGEAAEQAFEDEEYKVWKQTTKKDRALVAKERFQLFKDNKFNTEAPALVRSKAGMRRFLKRQREAEAEDSATKPTETLAEEIEEEEDKVIPDYYDTLSNIPDIHPKLQWVEDGEGKVINQHEEFLRLVPPGSFTAPTSRLTKKMDENIHQIQETRKLATRISVIKQMQVQTQVYTNQFPKSNSDPFVEQDIEPHFISDDGPVMAPETCQNALKRSIAKVLYHTGFEELQPSAMDAFTSVASDYFQKLCRTFNVYNESEKKPSPVHAQGSKFQPRFTPEEVILHTLDENGHDISSLELYAKDELDRLSTKLDALHERMKLHLTDLLRPALSQDAGTDGVGAFKDGSEQFVSGDFAEDLGEDFFGFRALGLDKEMGLDMISVPCIFCRLGFATNTRCRHKRLAKQPLISSNHCLLQSQSLRRTFRDQIGLVKNFFLAKLHANGDQPLVEDEDLPTKQKKPRPRLGASGKIVTAQKRSPKEQLALAKKKKKMEAAAAEAKANANTSPEKGAPGTTPGKKKSMTAATGPAPNPAVLALAPSMERQDSMHSQGNASQTDKDDTVGMMSPESIAP
ncbi:transcriptional activator SPT7 [Fusarium oxysporum]|nr:transcriptional activator SPT7 [Fusarium oxysporum]